MESQQLYDIQALASSASAQEIVASPRDEQLASWVRREVRKRGVSAANVIELGCGDGALSIAVAKELPDATVLGVDIALARVTQAAKSAASAGVSQARFQALDIDKDLGELPDHTADAVISIDVLEHVFDVFGFVAHAARIVKPGGIVVVRVPNLAYVRHRLSLLQGRLPVTSSWFGPVNNMVAWRSIWGWDGGHLHSFTQSSLSSLLVDAGLRPLEWRDPGVRFEHARRAFPGLLIGNLCVLAERPG
jgi:cyclopropane fatty-acyl-phospholipid synthase-like methyltransferase